MAGIRMGTNLVSPRCDCGRRIYAPELLKVTPMIDPNNDTVYPDATTCRVCLEQQGYICAL